MTNKRLHTKRTILALETSCDETAAAVLSFSDGENFPGIKTLSSVVKSQIKLHSKMGGVVPEVAARAHVKNILPVVTQALSTAHCSLSTINYIAVTQGPGLIPSLIVGVEFAKALSLATKKPIIPVNHMVGHLYSPLHPLLASPLKGEENEVPSPGGGGLGRGDKIFPMISLIVSGGHTMLVLVKNLKEYKILGQTVDDAAGEAFDKVAKLLKLPYPGGPEISKLAARGNPKAINFPRPMITAKNYDFSFSGLKTSVLYYMQSLKSIDYSLKTDICASFQQAAVDVLVSKTLRAAKEFNAKSISLSGGVAANVSLREKLQVESKKLKAKFFVPPLSLCTDNAEMIGLASAIMLYNGYKPKNYKNIKADPNLEL